MKKSAVLTLAVLATAVACSENPAGVTSQDVGLDQILITEGIATPAALKAAPSPRFSSLENAAPEVGGSSTSPISLNGAGCSAASPVQVTINYTVSGNQRSAASFKVYTSWSYNGTSFVGSTPQTVILPIVSGGGDRSIEIDITVSNASGLGTGSTQFIVAPFDLVTNTSDPSGLQLRLDSTSAATIHVSFIDCNPVPTNTAPSITVSADLTAEATSSAGAAVNFSVSATDLEDGDLTDDVICKVGADVVESGDTFQLGDTTVDCSVTDSGDLSAQGSFKITVEDTTAPVFTAFPGNQSLIAANINGAALDLSDYTISAEDKGPGGEAGDVSGPVTVSCKIGGANADGYQIAIGQTATVSCTAIDSSTHPSANTSAASTFDVSVGLDVAGVGFLAPLRMSAPFSAHKRNSAIPHKFPAPKYADGSLATDLAAGLRLVVVNLGVPTQTLSDATDDIAAGSTAWRWDPDAGHYIFNVKTGQAWMEGTWETTASFAGVQLAQTQFVLRK